MRVEKMTESDEMRIKHSQEAFLIDRANTKSVHLIIEEIALTILRNEKKPF